MKNLKYLIFLIPLSTWFSCTENNQGEINGTWVSSGFYNDKSFTTLTITDSTIIENEFGLNRMEYQIKREENGVEITDAYHHYPVGFELSRRNDKLVMSNLSDNSKIEFSKIDFKENFLKLLFSDSGLKIDLPESGEGDEMSIGPQWLWSPLYIGKPKDDYTVEDSDNPYQIHFFYNRVLQMKDIPNYLKIEKSKIDELNRDQLKIIIYADKTTPDSFLSRVITAIKKEDPKIKIYSARISLEEKRFQYFEVMY